MPDISEREQLTDSLFKKISSYVYDHARINLTQNKRELVRSRLGKVIRERGFKGYRDYYEYMTKDESGEALREVLNAVSTNLTSFFREPQHFDFLRDTLLPQLSASTGDKCLRAWSAGCSTCEEAYTISLVVLEHLLKDSDNRDDPRKRNMILNAMPGGWDTKILATDIDTNVVNTGVRGIYPKRRLQTMPMILLQKYFEKLEEGKEDEYKVCQDLKKMVFPRFLNLMSPWPFKKKFHFIFCRNVMIYFDRETQERLVNRFYDALEPGGYLFIGHSEGLTAVSHRFTYVQPTIYRR